MSNLRTIKIRGDSTENWELANPILEYKEIACEFTDNGTFFKVGNGTDSWNDLAYASIDDGIGEAPADGKLYARKDSAWAEVVVQGNAVTSVSGKTGAVTLAKEDVGLSNVDNTSDVDKPISNPTQAALDNKVDKETGKGLSTNDYSNADKAKLASLEGSHFRGVYVNEDALATIPNPVAGDYADVDAGIEADAERWIYDASDSKWVSQESAASVTAAQVKQLYESNTDTNAFTNVEKDKLSGIASEATKNRSDSENADKVHTHTITQVTGLDDALDNKVDKVSGKQLSDENYTLDEKNKLSGIASEATKNRSDSENADKVHTHAIDQVTGLDDALDSKASKTELTDALDNKVDKVTGKGLSDTNFTQVEKTKLSGIASEATKNRADSENADKVHTHTMAQVTGLDSALAGKVDKVSGKVLSDENYTSAEKSKLAALQGSKWKGKFVSLSALQSGVTTPEVGDYADVDSGVGSDIKRYIYDADDAKWVEQSGVVADLTGAQIKTLYEAEPDTNAFSDSDKSKLSSLPTNQTLTGMFDNKVDKETGKGLIEPAPEDGNEYVRKDGAWVEAVGGASALKDLTDVDNTPTRNNHILKWDDASQMWAKTYETIPTDEPGNGPAYVRAYNSWQPLSNYAIVEAPSDGKLYARSSGMWEEAPSYPTGSIASRPHWLRNGQTEVATLKGLFDVSWGTPSGGDVLTYNANTAKVEFGKGVGIEEAPNDSSPYVRFSNRWEKGVMEPSNLEGTFSLRKTSSGTFWVSALDPSNKKIRIGPGAIGHNGSFGGIAIGENSRSAQGGTVDVGSVAIGKAAKAYNQGDISIGAAAVTGLMSGPGNNSQMSRTAIGTDASAAGGHSIALGTEATSPHFYSVALGYGAAAESNNEIRLGGVDAIVKTQSNVVVVSDARDKADIQPHNLGLNFIKLLEPVKWKADPRSAYAPKREDFETDELYQIAVDSWDEVSFVPDGTHKGARFKHGLIAQQVKEVLDLLGEDFSGYIDDSITAGGSGNKALAYSTFISPLIKAVQEQQSMIEALTARLDALEGK